LRLIIAAARGNDQIRIQDLRGQCHVNIFRVAADGGDKPFGGLDSRLPKDFVLGRVPDERDHTFIGCPAGALYPVVNENDTGPASKQFVDNAPANAAGTANDVMSGNVFQHAMSALAPEIMR